MYTTLAPFTYRVESAGMGRIECDTHTHKLRACILHILFCIALMLKIFFFYCLYNAKEFSICFDYARQLTL